MRALLAALLLATGIVGASAQNYTAPTPPPGDSSNRIATTAFVFSALPQASCNGANQALTFSITTRLFGCATISGGGGGTGNVVGPGSSVTNDIAVYADTTGKLLADSGKLLPVGALVGTTDAQTLSAKTLASPLVTGGALFQNAVGTTAASTMALDEALGTGRLFSFGVNSTSPGTFQFVSATSTGTLLTVPLTLTNTDAIAPRVTGGALASSTLTLTSSTVTSNPSNTDKIFARGSQGLTASIDTTSGVFAPPWEILPVQTEIDTYGRPFVTVGAPHNTGSYWCGKADTPNNPINTELNINWCGTYAVNTTGSLQFSNMVSGVVYVEGPQLDINAVMGVVVSRSAGAGGSGMAAIGRQEVLNAVANGIEIGANCHVPGQPCSSAHVSLFEVGGGNGGLSVADYQVWLSGAAINSAVNGIVVGAGGINPFQPTGSSIMTMAGAYVVSDYGINLSGGVQNIAAFKSNGFNVDGSGNITVASCTGCGGGGGGSVTSVGNVDGTLTISPTTGAVLARVALGHANFWSGVQTFSVGEVVGAGLVGAPLLRFGTDATSGFYQPSNNQVGWSRLGVAEMTISGTAFTITTVPLVLDQGTVSSPSIIFGSDGTTGIYEPVNNQIGVTILGTRRFLVNALATTVATELDITGSSSGTVQIVAPATSTSPVLTLPNTAGTIAASAASPIVLNGVTGQITCPTCSTVTASALTKTDDTNVTLTLGGTPATALLQAVSMTLGWTGTLAVGRGGTGLASGTSGGVPYFSGTTTIASSALLTASAIVLGGGAGAAPAALGSLGTTTTVLHGNAAGAPTFGAVANADLTNSSVTVAGHTVSLGGTTTIAYADLSSGAPTATSSTLGLVKPDNTTITISAGVITAIGAAATTITIGTTTIGSGSSNGLLYDNAGVLGNLVTANSGVLITSGAGVPSISTTIPATTQGNITGTGTLTSGATGAGFTVAFGSSTLTGQVGVANGGTGLAVGTSGGVPYFSGTTTMASSALLTVNGFVLGGGAGAAPTSTARPTAGQIFIGQTAGAPVAAILSGDVVNDQTGATTIQTNVVSSSKLRQGVARSVIGVTGNATANEADIQGTANQALVVNSGGTALAFGAVNLASSAAVTGNLPVANLNSGTSASAATYWHGNGTWGTAVTPTTQKFLTGSGTYTTPAGVTWLRITLVGGGGGGSGAGTSNTAAGAGGDTCWNSSGAACTTPVYDAGGGVAGVANTGAGSAGGAISGSGTCVTGIGGTRSQSGNAVATFQYGGAGGGSAFFGGGAPTTDGGGNPGVNGLLNSGGGGSGGTSALATGTWGNGGGGGAGCIAIIGTPAATYTYAVGAAGTAGVQTGGTGAQNGGSGAAGGAWIEEHYE